MIIKKGFYRNYSDKHRRDLKFLVIEKVFTFFSNQNIEKIDSFRGTVMKKFKVLGGILVILGIVLYIFGSYISGEVAEGRKKIASAQGSVDTLKGISGVTPFSKDLGNMATGSAQKKIDAGRQDADQYETLANWLHGGGIVLFVAGIGLIIYSYTRKKKS